MILKGCHPQTVSQTSQSVSQSVSHSQVSQSVSLSVNKSVQSVSLPVCRCLSVTYRTTIVSSMEMKFWTSDNACSHNQSSSSDGRVLKCTYNTLSVWLSICLSVCLSVSSTMYLLTACIKQMAPSASILPQNKQMTCVLTRRRQPKGACTQKFTLCYSFTLIRLFFK